MANKMGYTCPCGKFHPAGGWGAAHWGERLVHNCDCGRTNTVLRGRILETVEPKKKKN